MSTGPIGQSASTHAESLWLAALHDLRQPLQSAVLLMSAAQDDADEERRRRMLQLAERSITGCQSMLDDLAFADRLLSGQRSSSPRDACRRPHEVFVTAIAELDGQPGLARVRSRATKRLPAVEQRPALIVVLALLATALKLTPAGPIDLIAEAAPAGATINLEYPPADAPPNLLAASFVELPLPSLGSQGRLFAPGLGLACRIATALGGSVERQSADTCHRICVLLPAA